MSDLKNIHTHWLSFSFISNTNFLGHDVENLDEGDMMKDAPNFEVKNMEQTKGYCKKKENKRKSICRNQGNQH